MKTQTDFQTKLDGYKKRAVQAADEAVQQDQTQKTDNLQVFKDITSTLQTMVSAVQDSDQGSQEAFQGFGDLLTQIKGSLDQLAAQESPDVATPIVEAVGKLEAALTAVKPVPPKVNVAAPNVSVNAPKVDLSGIQKVLQNDIPQAFTQAIATIPQPEAPEPIDWTPIMEILTDISKGVRMTPIQPLTIKVTNPDGSVISGGGGAVTNDGTFATPANQTNKTQQTQITNGTTSVALLADNSNSVSPTATLDKLAVLSRQYIFAATGNTWNQQRSIENAMNTSGIGSLATGIMAQFDDVSPGTVTENNFTSLRISANRNLYNTIRDAAGNERGVNVTAANALQTDGSATTQPVSSAGLTNIDVALSTRLKPADTLTKVSTVDTITNPVSVTGTFWQTTQPTSEVTGLMPKVYDYISANLSGSTADVYTYKAGGAGGTTAATLTVNWTDSTKTVLSTVVRT